MGQAQCKLISCVDDVAHLVLLSENYSSKGFPASENQLLLLLKMSMKSLNCLISNHDNNLNLHPWWPHG